MSRLKKVLDAVSQLGNVALLPRVEETTANDSISGRCYWEANFGRRSFLWKTSELVINALFWFDRQGSDRHCKLTYLRDVRRAEARILRYVDTHNS